MRLLFALLIVALGSAYANPQTVDKKDSVQELLGWCKKPKNHDEYKLEKTPADELCLRHNGFWQF